jgi:hypothetical protein
VYIDPSDFHTNELGDCPADITLDRSADVTDVYIVL